MRQFGHGRLLVAFLIQLNVTSLPALGEPKQGRHLLNLPFIRIIRATAKDEMCNFYMMFYSSAKNNEGQNSEVSYKECLLDGYSTWESFPYEGQALDYDDVAVGQPTERDVQASATEAKVAWESADRGTKRRNVRNRVIVICEF